MRFVVVNMQLLSHPFIKKYENTKVHLAAFVRSVFDPTQRLKDLADVSSGTPCVFSLLQIVLLTHVLLFIEHVATDSYCIS